MRYAFTLDGRTHHVVVEEHADGPRFLIGDESFEPQVESIARGQYKVTVGDLAFTFDFQHGRIEKDQQALDIEIRRARPALVRKGGAARRGDGRIKPPMPGKIIEVNVSEGQRVAEGDILVVLEAMKMQNDIKSPVAGTVTKVHVKPGSNVEAATIMVEVEPHGE